MISRYLEYSNPTFKKEVFAAGGQTIMVFSRLNEIITLDGENIKKLSRIFELLQEKGEDDDNEDKEMLYGTLVDTFEEEDYFVNHKEEKIEERNLKVMELASLPNENNDSFGNTFSNESLIAFGYLNSKDLYLEPNDLNMLIKDFKWFIDESGRCKEETKIFIDFLIRKMEKEIRLIENESTHVNLFVCGL